MIGMNLWKKCWCYPVTDIIGSWSMLQPFTKFVASSVTSLYNCYQLRSQITIWKGRNERRCTCRVQHRGWDNAPNLHLSIYIIHSWKSLEGLCSSITAFQFWTNLDELQSRLHVNNIIFPSLSTWSRIPWGSISWSMLQPFTKFVASSVTSLYNCYQLRSKITIWKGRNKRRCTCSVQHRGWDNAPNLHQKLDRWNICDLNRLFWGKFGIFSENFHNSYESSSRRLTVPDSP